MAKINIDGRFFTGTTVTIRNGRVSIDGKSVDGKLTGKVEIRIVEGQLQNLETDGDVTVEGDILGNVDAGMSVNAKNIHGDVDAGMSVTCGDVSGNVDSGMSVTCGTVGGDVNSSFGVTMRKR